MRVLIVRLGSMGDVLHALPAVAALRATHPDAYIGWAIERRWTPFLEAPNTESGCPTLIAPDFGAIRWGTRPLVDRVHVVDTLGWRRAPFSAATWSDVRTTFRDLRAERYDIAIDFQGAIKSALVAQLSRAPRRIGFAQPREKPATMFYTHLVQPTATHIIDQNLALVSSVFPLCTSVPSVVNGFPVDLSAESEVDRRLSALRAPRPAPRFAILNPGAGWPAKQWPAARYAEVARALRDDGIFSIVNYGPGEDSLAREVETASDGSARPISCTLPELIALTRRAALFIGGDTGPMHLAALLGVPTVAIFGPTDPARNGPYDFGTTKSEIENQKSKMLVVLRHPSSRTDYTHHDQPDHGLLQVTAGEVITAARELLSRHPRPAPRDPEPAR